MAGLLLTGGVAFASQTNVLETGSTLLYPLFNLWVPAYAGAHPNIKITTQGTGSGTGIAQAISGIAQIGASDAYLSNGQMKAHNGMLNIPLAISSQMVSYNVPGLNGDHLKLSGPVVAGIYSGSVTYWDDAAIAKLNPGVSLPHKVIVPIHRSDGSGDTFLFSQFLAFSTPSWAKTLAYGTTINWPRVQGAIGAQGNPGMVNATKGTPYSVAYIGISFKKATDSAGLGEAMLKNRAGRFVLSNARTDAAAVAATVGKTPPDERVSLIFASGANSYPIINYEYAIVKSHQRSAEMGKELKTLFNWAISPKGGNSPSFLSQVGFVSLPASVRALSERQIAKIR